MLLFDEADALFGSGPRCATATTATPTSRWATCSSGWRQFRGLAILTTNSRAALDQAFTRRLRTIVTFPYPEQPLREAMWRRAFPATTPTSDLDLNRLSQVDVPGGGIAAIALTAAYLAAADGRAVDDAALDTAARWELAKSGRTMSRRTP